MGQNNLYYFSFFFGETFFLFLKCKASGAQNLVGI